MWYIRSAFCSHEWEYEEKQVETDTKNGQKVFARCKECGWHRKYWKYL